MIRYIKISWRFLIIFSCVFVNVLNGFAQTKSNAVLSSRTFHPSNSKDRYSTVRAIKTLNPDRIDWTYVSDPEKLKVYRDLGLKYSLAINPQIPDSLAYTTTKSRIVDINGIPFIASWMKGWNMKNPYWGCVNNPQFKKLFLDKSTEYVKMGAYALFVDDAAFNTQLQKEKVNKYGCFCRYCLDDFKRSRLNSNRNKTADFKTIATDIEIENLSEEEVKTLSDYQKFQVASVVNFFKEWRAELLKINPDLKFLTNNFKGSWDEVFQVFDGGIAELGINDMSVERLDTLFKKADSLHKTQLFSLASQNTDAQYFLMAYCQLRNRDFIIPWDLFAPDKRGGKKRYYGDLDEMKKLISDFDTKKLRVEISAKPFRISQGTDMVYYRIEDRGGYKAFVLNRSAQSEEPQTKQAKNFIKHNLTAFIAIGAGVFVVVVILLFVRLRSKKNTSRRRRR